MLKSQVKNRELRIEFLNQKEYLNFQLLRTKRGLWFFSQLGVVPSPLCHRIILFLKCSLEIASSLWNPLGFLSFPLWVMAHSLDK